MPSSPAVLTLLVEKMRVQVREGRAGKAGGMRPSSSSSSNGRRNLSKVAAGVAALTSPPTLLRCRGRQVHLVLLRSHAVWDKCAGSTDGLGPYQSTTESVATDAPTAGGLGPFTWWCA